MCVCGGGELPRVVQAVAFYAHVGGLGAAAVGVAGVVVGRYGSAISALMADAVAGEVRRAVATGSPCRSPSSCAGSPGGSRSFVAPIAYAACRFRVGRVRPVQRARRCKPLVPSARVLARSKLCVTPPPPLPSPPGVLSDPAAAAVPATSPPGRAAPPPPLSVGRAYTVMHSPMTTPPRGGDSGGAGDGGCASPTVMPVTGGASSAPSSSWTPPPAVLAGRVACDGTPPLPPLARANPGQVVMDMAATLPPPSPAPAARASKLVRAYVRVCDCVHALSRARGPQLLSVACPYAFPGAGT